MPWKWKASKACTENLQAARETFSGKWWKSTPADSNLSDAGDEGRISDDEIVCFKSFKTYLKPLYNVPDG